MTAKIPDKIPTTTSTEQQVPKGKIDTTQAGPINKEAAKKEASKSSVTPEEREKLKQLLKNSNWFTKVFVYMKLEIGWLKGSEVADELENEIEKEKSGLPSKITEVEAQKTEQAPEQGKLMAAAYDDDSDDEGMDDKIDIEESEQLPLPPLTVNDDILTMMPLETTNAETPKSRTEEPLTEGEINELEDKIKQSEDEHILASTTKTISDDKLKAHLETARHIGMSTQEIIDEFKKKGYIQ